MNNNVRDLRPLTALSPNGEDNKYPKCFDTDSHVFNCKNNTVETDFCTISEVLDNRGEIIQSKLENYTEKALEIASGALLSYDNSSHTSESNYMNEKVVECVLSNTEGTNEGRLIMPLPWNPQSQHLLGTTTASVRKFSCQILKNFRRITVCLCMTTYSKNKKKLGLLGSSKMWTLS